MLFGDDNDDDEAKQSNMREVSEREWSDRVFWESTGKSLKD